jgi:hypothetical protein
MAVALATAGACANAMLTTERLWRLRSGGILHALGHSYCCRHRPLHTSLFTDRICWILHGNGERDRPNKIDRGRKPEADDARRSDRGGSAGPVDVSSRLKTKARPQQPHARTLLNRLAQAGARRALDRHPVILLHVERATASGLPLWIDWGGAANFGAACACHWSDSSAPWPGEVIEDFHDTLGRCVDHVRHCHLEVGLPRTPYIRADLASPQFPYIHASVERAACNAPQCQQFPRT